VNVAPRLAAALRDVDGVVAVAPHPDDVAESAGGFVRRLAERWAVTVVTVFCESTWAPKIDPARRTAAYVTRVRRAEDEAYCAALGLQRRELGLPDASLRGYDDDSERGPMATTDRVREQVEPGIAAALAAFERPFVLCPAAIGGHVDHVIVRDAVLALAGGAPVLLYEDLPYAIEAPPLSRAPVAAATVGVSVAIEVAQKLRDLGAYESQIRASDRAAVRQAADRTGGSHERFWLVSADV
jgi:LmbE family N-acetylglucosaminyl deacetylase